MADIRVWVTTDGVDWQHETTRFHSVEELADATGVPAARLRIWDDEREFPTPDEWDRVVELLNRDQREAVFPAWEDSFAESAAIVCDREEDGSGEAE